jgi:flagellin
MMAYDSGRRLNLAYAQLAKNTERLSSGLRLNGPGDGPAEFAVREMMRSDMTTLQQGLRNAADGFSLLETAEGAMAVIDEKLIRMKELAEQAATGTYTTVQREIINSEYQAMAAEIDRIANATNFNGIRLLDGSISDLHHGLGLKIHFGLTDSPAEDYYFADIGDVRATAGTGLRLAGDAHNDLWGNTSYGDAFLAAACCGGGAPSLDEAVSGWRTGDIFSFGYNWDLGVTDESALTRGRYIAGAWQSEGDLTLGQLLSRVNHGTQARVRLDIATETDLNSLVSGEASAHAFEWCFGDEIYYHGSAGLVAAARPESAVLTRVSSAWTSPASALAAAINDNAQSKFWARVEDQPGLYREGFTSIYVFFKEGGDQSRVAACDKALGLTGDSRRVEDLAVWYNDETETADNRGVNFGNGGKYWGILTARPNGYGSWSLELAGRDSGAGRDLKILAAGPGGDLDLGQLAGAGFGRRPDGEPAGNLSGLGPTGFVELQNADDGDWAGAHLRTQSHAQEALEAITAAIERKEKIRTALGSYMNRLENTMNHLEISVENLQGSESRISDVDTAREMSRFVKNQVLTQVNISILSQANSLPQMALSLLNG